ncbi:MAG: hypothetical protein COX71_05830 [Flavobacteriales bacterium CG_4_10_14_0_2_um_filter_35_18]|nr:MAG: hypothetical protein COX71_05830 [Flavobacteriales bacterium CG_4_10_14_0_2_um_filter_35_18]
MIKFFRNIHKKLLQKNKITNPALTSGRYLKYNIGEIFLVAINKKALCPVRDNILVETNKNEPIQRAIRYAI